MQIWKTDYIEALLGDTPDSQLDRFQLAAMHQKGLEISMPNCACVLCSLCLMGEKLSIISWDEWPSLPAA